MSLTNNLLRFALSLKLIFGAFIACVIAFSYYGMARNDIHTANELRYTSLLLTHELRQSSDDLTRMVRTYVATGERRYLNQFDEILAIRDGLAPRPQEYDNVYWDLVLDDRRPSTAGAASPLLQRMKDAGFTDEELNRLNVAKQNSDLLVATERQAMALVETGDTSAITPELRLQAIRMLNDAGYHRAKADIMGPIAEVIRMVNTRTADAVASAENREFAGLALFVLAGAVLMLALWWTYRNLQLVFGGSVSQLHAAVASTGSGNAPATVVAGNGDRDSIIGKLVDAQHLRANDEGRRKDSERAVSEAEHRLRSIVGALDDGVCVVQDALIRFVNPKLQDILVKQEAELVDRPFIQFVHDEDRVAIMERYRKRMQGVPIEPANEFRVCIGPGVLRKIMCRGTQFEWAGRPATLYFINTAEAVHTV